MFSSATRLLRFSTLAALLTAVHLSTAPPTGILEGHLKVLSVKEVDLQDDAKAAAQPAEQPFSEYPLIVRRRDSGKEIAHVSADARGNYRVALPPGEYMLDIQRQPPKRIRANPKPFTIAADQTARVDMEIDTGIR